MLIYCAFSKSSIMSGCYLSAKRVLYSELQKSTCKLAFIKMLLSQYDKDTSFLNDIESKHLLEGEIAEYKGFCDYTPLCWAVIHQQHFTIIEELINQGATVREINPLFRNTALHCAAKKVVNLNSVKIVNILIYNGAEVNARDINDQTPLSVLVENGANACYRLLAMHELLQHGADAMVSDCTNKCVLDLAFYNVIQSEFRLRTRNLCTFDHLDYVKMIELLIKNGAYPKPKYITHIVNASQNTNSFFCCDCFRPRCLCNYRLRVLALLVMKHGVMNQLHNILYKVKQEFATNFAILINNSSRYEYFLKTKTQECYYLTSQCDMFINQIAQMRNDRISSDLTLFQFIIQSYNRIGPKNTTVTMINAILNRIAHNLYPLCNDIIYFVLTRNALMKQEIYLSFPILKASGETEVLILNFNCMNRLKNYLSEKDIINLFIASLEILSN